MVNTVRTVTVIPSSVNPITRQAVVSTVRRRVAAYARVSTDSDEQYTSYEAQIDYYSQFIKAHSDWQFVKVYTDEGISGLNMKNREGFNEMISDALAGDFTLIVTKSVSRFARNTVDSLTTIRSLKDHGVEVFFEKENIWTFDSKGELLITIMSSLAQEESRSISENVTWGKRKRFADGQVYMPYKKFLGYEKGPDGMPKVVPEQAKTVQYIYDLFMGGKTVAEIAKQLSSDGISTPSGKQIWQASTVESILKNEKYKGDARLQKRFTVDFLQKKTKVNEGEVPQYYVENSHEAIIDPLLFDRVQEEFVRRKALGRSYSGKSIISCRVVCGDCGCFYGPKVWDSNNKYRRVVWQCNNKYKGKGICLTPHLTEETAKAGFLEAYNRLLPDRKRLIEDCLIMRNVLTDSSDLDHEKSGLIQEADVIAGLIQQLVHENSNTTLDQKEYLSRYNELITRYERVQARIKDLNSTKSDRGTKANAINAFINRLKKQALPLEYFDERLWLEVIDRVIVHRSGDLVFIFQNGMDITVEKNNNDR